jgi:hypothetical protein
MERFFTAAYKFLKLDKDVSFDEATAKMEAYWPSLDDLKQAHNERKSVLDSTRAALGLRTGDSIVTKAAELKRAYEKLKREYEGRDEMIRRWTDDFTEIKDLLKADGCAQPKLVARIEEVMALAYPPEFVPERFPHWMNQGWANKGEYERVSSSRMYSCENWCDENVEHGTAVWKRKAHTPWQIKWMPPDERADLWKDRPDKCFICDACRERFQRYDDILFRGENGGKYELFNLGDGSQQYGEDGSGPIDG